MRGLSGISILTLVQSLLVELFNFLHKLKIRKVKVSTKPGVVLDYDWIARNQCKE